MSDLKEYVVTLKDYDDLNDFYDDMETPGGDVTDYTSLQGANNRYLLYYKERPDTGALTPKNDFFIRPTTGRVYPRVKVRR